MRQTMAVLKMQTQESSGSQGHKHLWLENDSEQGKMQEMDKMQEMVLGRPAESGSRGGWENQGAPEPRCCLAPLDFSGSFSLEQKGCKQLTGFLSGYKINIHQTSDSKRSILSDRERATCSDCGDSCCRSQMVSELWLSAICRWRTRHGGLCPCSGFGA